MESNTVVTITNYVTEHVTNVTETTTAVTNTITEYAPEVVALALNQSISWFIGALSALLAVFAIGIVSVGLVKFFTDRNWKGIRDALNEKNKEVERIILDTKEHQERVISDLVELWSAQSVSFIRTGQWNLAVFCLFNVLDARLSLESCPASDIESTLEHLKNCHTGHTKQQGGGVDFIKEEYIMSAKKTLSERAYSFIARGGDARVLDSMNAVLPLFGLDKIDPPK